MATKYPRTGEPRLDAIIKMADSICTHGHGRRDIFFDFVATCAYTLSNKFDQHNFAVREAEYMRLVKKYGPDVFRNTFPKMLGELMLAYAEGLGDHLGKIAGALDVLSGRAGQFFTPYHLSSLMAKMTLDEAHFAKLIEKDGFFTLQEPACGSGGMVIAVAEQVAYAGGNYATQMHATMVDIDLKCVQMAYVACSLAGIPAIILHGNTISLETWSTWYTPTHVLCGWDRKLRLRKETEKLRLAFRSIEDLIADGRVPTLAENGQMLMAAE